jgi:DNA-binding transcriptional regulator YhcF (GntR family)
MPQHRTDKVEQVKQRLIDRLQHGFYRPGDRFLSNRAVAELFGISYQTAHRLIAELTREGHLERRPQSGTYVPGEQPAVAGVQVLFHDRARQEGSFGAKLLGLLVRQLELERIDAQVEFVGDDKSAVVAADRLPIVWELPDVVAECVRRECQALLLNNRPASGLESLHIDSVSTDDFSGGACAAQLLRDHTGKQRGFAIVAGPADDRRSVFRSQGFASVVKAATVRAGSWFFDQGRRVAAQAVKQGKSGIFCVNDQLAAGVLAWCAEQEVRCPPIVGFDDAPIAERLNLTTISLPWTEMIDGVVRTAKRRLAGDRGTSSHQLFQPRPVVRGFGSNDPASDAA